MRPDDDSSQPMGGMTRRSLLKASGVIGAGALLAGAAGITLHELLASGDSDGSGGSAASAAGAGTPILVVVTLYGGNDGLGLLVPYADPAYHDARPELAYTADEVLKLDDGLGLNRKLPAFARLWQDRRLAIVRGVGYPHPDHSHFRSMDIWQTASPDHPIGTGWLGRWLDAAKGDPLLAVSLGETLPPLAVGATATAVALVPEKADRKTGRAGAALRQGYANADPADPVATRAAAQAYATLLRSEQTFAPALTATSAGADPNAGPSGGATGGATDPADAPDQAAATATGGHGRSSIESQLALVARCIRAGVPTRAYAVSQPGYDSHTQERAIQEGLFGQLDAAVAGFFAALAGTPRERDVVLMIHSEFGRRVRANASQGTDHGTAAPVLLVGSRVAPGFHCDQPSLTELDGGDLKATCDFRSIYGELAEKVLGVDAGRVVPQPTPSLGVLASA